MSAVTTRNALVKVLEAHEYDVVGAGGAFSPACKCGWQHEGPWSGTEVFEGHVADALLTSGAVVDANTLADELRGMGAVWGGDGMWLTTGTKVADLMAETITDVLSERGGDQ